MLWFEKLTCFPVSGPGGSGLGPLCSLVPVPHSAGELTQEAWTALGQKSREPSLLAVLQPPTQGWGLWVEGGEQRLDDMKPVFGCSADSLEVVMADFKGHLRRRPTESESLEMESANYIYNTLSGVIPMHTSV